MPLLNESQGQVEPRLSYWRHEWPVVVVMECFCLERWVQTQRLTPPSLSQEDSALDDIIDRLLDVRNGRPGKPVQLSEQEVRQLCLTAKEIFMSQPNLLELEAPIKICGECRFDMMSPDVAFLAGRTSLADVSSRIPQATSTASTPTFSGSLNTGASRRRRITCFLGTTWTEGSRA